MGFEVGNGYGVEFDSYSNEFDPAYNHVSLFQNNPDHSLDPPLAQAGSTSFEDSQWHDVKINVGTVSVNVYLDGALALNWNGTLDGTYSGIGFTASTGYYYNTQYIDDVVITKPATVSGITSSLADGAYTAGTIVPIQVSFNDTVTVTGTPQLALNTSRAATYASGSGTSTLTFNYTVQAGDNVADLNYTSTAALTLNDGTITDSVGNAAILTLPALTDVNSLGGAKQLQLDTTGPTGTITIATYSPATSTVTFALSATDGAAGTGVAQMRFSNDNATWSAWESYATGKIYSLPAGTGSYTVYVQFSDALGNVGPPASVHVEPAQQEIYIPSLLVQGGTLLQPFTSEQSTYTLLASPEAASTTLVVSLVNGPYRLAVSGAVYSVTADSVPSSVVQAADTTAITPGVTAAVYRVQVQLEDAAAFQLQIVHSETATILKTYSFNVVRSMPWLQSAIANDTDTEITLIGRTPLRQDVTLLPSSFQIEGGPIVVGAYYDPGDAQHRTVKLTLAEPLPAGIATTLTIDSAITTEDGSVISVAGYPIFGTTQQQQARRAIDQAQDGVHMDDIMKYLSGASGGDLNGDGSFDLYDAELLLSLIDPRMVSQ
jgi:hypothetical protein